MNVLDAIKRPSRAQKGYKGDLSSADCPSRGVLDHVTSRWGSLVLMVLLDGAHRFSELRRRIGGVSEKMLAQSLRALEGDGFVLRTVYATVPPQVEYSLTPLGLEVATHISGLTCWIEDNLPKVMSVRAKLELR
ncbi:winged helix-turn-helix transcriptional regulator [Granulicella tundricola]|uniref:Transcriptional regulator, HxlR family n=1 Tax=Granulicella tundricola (strain ATCC BAA-1859 / DSM 23138 / MP5ACTX9) TaxID=1198114 RepID=E8WZ20_GRATM|nr:helix-turn-helix domain-containing protein [Granulicella tundricola]ADW69935.1 transcriptional regulator, HxlR family [Granulicella tundricola MP5ACTX9]